MEINEKKELVLTQEDLEKVMRLIDMSDLTPTEKYIINSMDASAQCGYDVIIKPYGWNPH